MTKVIFVAPECLPDAEVALQAAGLAYVIYTECVEDHTNGSGA